MLRPSRSIAVVCLAAAVQAGGSQPTCTDPATCPPGWVSAVEQHVAAHGTPPGTCATCTGDVTAPGGPGCVFGEWDTQGVPPAPRLTLPKFVPPPGAWRLDAVDIVLRGRLCTVVRVEQRDPLSGCTLTYTGDATIAVVPSAGQGLQSLPPLYFFVPQSLAAVLGPFDGTVDFQGPSGVTAVLPEATVELCWRITDAAQLAAFTSDGVGSDVLTFDHWCSIFSPFSGCGPGTYSASPFAGLELEVSYNYCVSPALALCFGTDAVCPCGNGGAPGAGCDNAQGTGGVQLTASGDPGQGTLLMRADGFPATTAPAALLLRSPGSIASPVPFGDGTSCLSPGSLSFAGATLAAGGSASIPVASTGPGRQTYELRYRNVPASFCDAGAAFNTSNAVLVDWP